MPNPPARLSSSRARTPPAAPRRALAAALALAAGVVLGGCGGDDGEPAAPDPDADVVVRARDNRFDAESYRAAPGEVAFSYVEDGNLPHTLLIEGVDGFRLSVRPSDEVDNGAVELATGTYTLFCDVPGHRSTMEATLEVS